jgi:glycosyltransferase involved in cell wall biosynthesis
MQDLDGGIKTLSVLMPVYNERWTLQEIVRRVLQSPISLAIELIIVDDCSSDGSWELIERLAAADSRIRAFRHPQNRGKGAAIRTAIQHITGDVAVVQDADLEYDPNEYPLLLAPILEGKADAVFGSRFAGDTHRVLFFWHAVVNRMLTLASNMFNDVNMTDMETCYKMARADILKALRLKAETFTLEPELTCRLAQWRARMYEAPISYAGRTYDEGKKIRAMDGVKALWQMLYSTFIDVRFTDHIGYYALTALAGATRYNRWFVRQFKHFLGQRVLDAGAGLGTLGGMIANRERLLLADNEPLYVSAMQQRFRLRDNIRVENADLASPETWNRWKNERLDTILGIHVLEHVESDESVLRSFHETLAPGGHCIVAVPAGRWLYTSVDKELGHRRRYSKQELLQKMTNAGFQVVHTKEFCRVGALGWAIAGHLLRCRYLSPRQMAWFDRLWPVTKFLDFVLPSPGLSLLMVGRKSTTN